ncbi:MAG: hypothetical protein WKG07_48935 [Hymenobacter sp.]
MSEKLNSVAGVLAIELALKLFGQAAVAEQNTIGSSASACSTNTFC